MKDRDHLADATKAKFMQRALALAERGSGRVSPNPLVGAVLVRKGRIIAEGWHRWFGGPHAEIECIRRAHGDLSGATLYVNLEPCTHYGKTPPCVDRILEAGIRHVVIAMQDPNPLVPGTGISRLRGAGVRVSTGLLSQEAAVLNRFFVKHITTGYPYVHVKVAVSLDGYIGNRKASGRFTSRESLRLVHSWRGTYDAVLVGAGTIKVDNPRLTTRLVRGRDPDVVILDGKFSVASEARIFHTGRKRRIFLCTNERYMKTQKQKAVLLESRGVNILCFRGKKGMLDLREILTGLYHHRIGSVLVEGGSSVFAQFLQTGVVDEMSTFVSPVLLGRGVPPFAAIQYPEKSSRPYHVVTVREVGGDLLYTIRFPEGETKLVHGHH